MTKLAALSPLFLLFAACAGGGESGLKAQAAIKPTQGNAVSGTVSFQQRGAVLHVEATLSGLTPGAHGFHVHEKGDCSAGDASSAGGHFNPHGKMHGHPGQGEHHAGDMPQLMADASGKASLTVDLAEPGMGAGLGNVVGRSVVVHAGPDDFKSQPAGNSGARVACGVIVAG